MKGSRDILGTSIIQFAKIIAQKRNRPFLNEVAGEPVDAEINHGRWIVRCPICSGAELADPEEPVFLCLSCFNEGNDGKLLPIHFPHDYLAIESALAKRGKIETQNWLPGETSEDIERENLKNGGAR